MQRTRSQIAGLALLVSINLAVRSSAQGPFSVAISFSRNHVSDCEPLYFSIRLKNESNSDAELQRTETFTFEQGDVAPLHRRGGTDDQWKGVRLSPAAGTSSPLRLKPRVIAPGEGLEVIECLMPANLGMFEEATPWEFKGAFLRKDKTQLTSDIVKVIIAPERDERAQMLEAVIVLCVKGPEHRMDDAEAEAVNAAAGRSPPVARLAEIFKRFDGLRKFDSTRDQKPVIRELAALVEKLPPIEREYWACRLAKIHIIAAGPLLKPQPAYATFHLDVCSALDKAMGITTDKADWIRSTCVEHRKWADWYSERQKQR
jgi:hypothetical protein